MQRPFHHKSTYRRINWFLIWYGKNCHIIEKFPVLKCYKIMNDEDFLNGLLSLLCIVTETIKPLVHSNFCYASKFILLFENIN
jgi:hypothetical protein